MIMTTAHANTYRQTSNISRTKSADGQCSNYIWVINNFIVYYGATNIIGLTVYEVAIDRLVHELFFLVFFYSEAITKYLITWWPE